MLLKAYNKSLIKDREKTYLTAAVAVGGTTLTVAGVNADVGSDSTWADNTYIIVGEIGSPTAEVLQMAAAASDGTSLTIDQLGAGGTRFAHAIGEPVYRIDYNRVEFNRNTTDSTSGVTVLATQLIQPDDEYTRYEDTTNTTGYGFIRWNNQTATTFSSYSDGVNYEASGTGSSEDSRTLWQLRKRVRWFLREVKDLESRIDDDSIRQVLNDKQRDIGHRRLWSFYEAERSLSLVANQFAYDIPATVQKIHQVYVDTQPLIFLSYSKWKQLQWDTSQTSDDQTHFSVWNNQILVYPRRSTASSTTALNGALTSSATTATVDATSGFNQGDYYRFIIDSEVIYATGSTSTTFTGLLRGREGTTAAAHSDDATVTERDIVYSHHVEPTDLQDTQDRTTIPEPEGLAIGAAADLALMLEKETLHDRLQKRFEEWIKSLEAKYALKQTGQASRVKDTSELVQDSMKLQNPNLYPRDLS